VTTAALGHVGVLDGTHDSVREFHALFRETLGALNVEDAESFRATTSPLTDDAALPKLVGAFHDVGLIGAMIGLYLRNLNAGMILYAGVREPFRGRGLYTKMRQSLLSELADHTTHDLGFVLSEIEEGDWLAQKYLNEWGAFIAPCEYVQPAAQGLQRRQVDLLIVPIAKTRAEITEGLSSIIEEVFSRVYRIADTERHPDFRHAVESIRT
jgi:hypothetical protein